MQSRQYLIVMTIAGIASQPTELQIQEIVTVSSFDRTEAVLYAYVNNEQVAALDFTKSEHRIYVNVVIVKPEFRRRGIGSALVQHLITQYPGLIICFSPCHVRGPRFPTSNEGC